MSVVQLDESLSSGNTETHRKFESAQTYTGVWPSVQSVKSQ